MKFFNIHIFLFILGILLLISSIFGYLDFAYSFYSPEFQIKEYVRENISPDWRIPKEVPCWTYVNHFERRNFEMRGLLEALGFKVKH